MTEGEWLTSTDPKAMLDDLRGNASDRKLRLFACACCRHVRPQTHHQDVEDAVGTAEQYADGLTTKVALKRARQGVRAIRHGIPASDGSRVLEWVALWLAEVVASENAFGSVSPEIERLSGLGLLGRDNRPCEVRLLRCIFGNPFRPVSIDPVWQATNVLGLAESIYEERAFDRMPVLGDALEDARCDNTDILNHCRGPGPHVRGCWVVDLVAGRT